MLFAAAAGVDLPLWQGISSAIFFVLLAYFAGPPLAKLLRQRERHIVETLARADVAQNELAALRAKNPDAQALVWLPIKDLETLDSFLRDLEDEVAAPMVVAETRMRPLSDPMKMNGCGLVLLDGPDLEAPLAAICGWVAQALGAGGGARVYALSPQ